MCEMIDQPASEREHMTTTLTTSERCDRIPEILIAVGIDITAPAIAYQMRKVVDSIVMIEDFRRDVLTITKQVSDECADIDRYVLNGISYAINTSWVANGTKRLCDAVLTLDSYVGTVRDAIHALSLLVEPDQAADLRKALFAVVQG